MVRQLLMCAALAAAVAGCAEIPMTPEPSWEVGRRAVAPGGPPLEYNLRAFGGMAVETGPATATAPATSTAPATQKQAVKISVQDAILSALHNNPSLKVQKYDVPISRTREENQRAVFDPTVTGSVSAQRNAVPFNQQDPRRAGTALNDSISASVGYAQFFPTGTTIGLDGTINFGAENFYSDSTVVTRAGLTVTQALLRGASVDANLALLRESQIDTKTSQYQLRAFAETLIADIESAYWDYAYAKRQIEIVKTALQVAQEQLDQTNELIRVGRQAESERAAAEAEVAVRKGNVIDAESALRQARIRVVQLTTSPENADYAMGMELSDAPFTPPGTLDDVENHVKVALMRRPEIAQAKLQIDRGELEVVRTKDGLLPRLDLFATLGKSGYSRALGASIQHVADGPGYDAQIGVQVEYPLLNRAAQADYRRANLGKDQANEALNNLIQVVQGDVRGAYIEAQRTREQIDATMATRIAQATKAQVEEEKFKVGKSTSLLVAAAQRDLLVAQIAEVQAVTGHLKALVALYRLEGTLLDRRYISAPGAQ
jgi:outer membrane protein TolC